MELLIVWAVSAVVLVSLVIALAAFVRAHTLRVTGDDLLGATALAVFIVAALWVSAGIW